MLTNPIDLTTILNGLDGKWVVLSFDKTKVIISGNSLEDVLEREREGIIMRVQESEGSFSPDASTVH